MSEVIFLAAMSKNGVIGADGKIPWHNKEDIKRFREITLGNPVVMGRKTWESLPNGPLDGRCNIVLSKSKNKIENQYVHTYTDLRPVLFDFNHREKIYVIGGAEIFKAYMDFASILDITIINEEVNGDVFFPEFDHNGWNITTRQGDSAIFMKYKRII